MSFRAHRRPSSGLIDNHAGVRGWCRHDHHAGSAPSRRWSLWSAHRRQRRRHPTANATTSSSTGTAARSSTSGTSTRTAQSIQRWSRNDVVGQVPVRFVRQPLLPLQGPASGRCVDLLEVEDTAEAPSTPVRPIQRHRPAVPGTHSEAVASGSSTRPPPGRVEVGSGPLPDGGPDQSVRRPRPPDQQWEVGRGGWRQGRHDHRLWQRVEPNAEAVTQRERLDGP